MTAPGLDAAGRTGRLARWRADGTAGLVLGVESVPDGLASGVLAGVNPLAGLYAYLFGMVGAAAFTGSSLMAVQATGAMALVVSDSDLQRYEDPDRALFTLAMLTGVVMVASGLVGGGRMLRFVPTAVMTGFVTAVGVNIVLGQLADFTGYDAEGSNRVLRALDLALHLWRVDPATLTVGTITVLGILLLPRTRIGSVGLVLAVILGSLAAVGARAAGHEVALVNSIASVPRSLPWPTLPDLSILGGLLIPALSLAFVGLVQGAAVSVGVPNPDGTRADASRDFVGQGAGNLAAGLFQGMPVGGSMSASALVQASGARSRWSLVVAGGVMAVVVLVLADVVGRIALPALAGLLIVVGAGAIRPAQVASVVRTGPLKPSVMTVTFGLTLLIPLQYAVLVGVGLAIVLHVAQQSNRLTVRALVPEGTRVRDEKAPVEVAGETVVVLQPWGQLFFASAPTFEGLLPRVGPASSGAVVVLRLRGIDQLGIAASRVIAEYAAGLRDHGATLKLVIASDQVERQLEDAGALAVVGPEHVYRGSQWLGETTRRAYDDAQAEIAARRSQGGGES